jgi:4-hydroxythreonine-4-phosphate dehydrogenase
MSLKKSLILKSCKIRVGISLGDPSGIGPAITLKSIQKLRGLADFVVIGDAWVFDKVQSSKFKVQSCKFIDLNNVEHKNFAFGKVRAEYGRASVEYLDKALELIKNKEIDCLVTCPVSKEAANLAGIKFSGHTEYLAGASGTKDFVMMLLNKKLKIALATRHIPLKDVSKNLDKDKLYKTIFIAAEALKKLFFLKNPRIVVCGLNPHASDNGIIGKEENKVIKPVLEKLRARLKGARIDGPLSSDIAIYKTDKGEYDCAIAMYHDQALIPLKLTDFQSGVNLTLGLPFIRTSPLHGTAFDIAKNPGLANPNSLIAAIRLAVKCALNLKNA